MVPDNFEGSWCLHPQSSSGPSIRHNVTSQKAKSSINPFIYLSVMSKKPRPTKRSYSKKFSHTLNFFYFTTDFKKYTVTPMGITSIVNTPLKQFNVEKCRYDMRETQSKLCRQIWFLLWTKYLASLIFGQIVNSSVSCRVARLLFTSTAEVYIVHLI